jgi:hypothetical protein
MQTPPRTAMPWTCPKCNLNVGHGDPNDPLPRIGIIYRCSVCRLLLTFDPINQKMIPLPPPKPPNTA